MMQLTAFVWDAPAGRLELLGGAKVQVQRGDLLLGYLTTRNTVIYIDFGYRSAWGEQQ